jgi:hypothetical protein
VLQRQVGRPVFIDVDRAVLAGLLHHLPGQGSGVSCCWSARTRSCAGTGTSFGAVTRRGVCRSGAGDR